MTAKVIIIYIVQVAQHTKDRKQDTSLKIAIFLDESVEDHGSAVVEVNLVLLHAGLGACSLRVPSTSINK